MFDPYSEILKIQAEATRIQSEERARDAQLQRERDALEQEKTRQALERLQSVSR